LASYIKVYELKRMISCNIIFELRAILLIVMEEMPVTHRGASFWEYIIARNGEEHVVLIEDM
jgi:hypothetical protein